MNSVFEIEKELLNAVASSTNEKLTPFINYIVQSMNEYRRLDGDRSAQHEIIRAICRHADDFNFGTQTILINELLEKLYEASPRE